MSSQWKVVIHDVGTVGHSAWDSPVRSITRIVRKCGKIQNHDFSSASNSPGEDIDTSLRSACLYWPDSRTFSAVYIHTTDPIYKWLNTCPPLSTFGYTALTVMCTWEICSTILLLWAGHVWLFWHSRNCALCIQARHYFPANKRKSIL